MALFLAAGLGFYLFSKWHISADIDPTKSKQELAEEAKVYLNNLKNQISPLFYENYFHQADDYGFTDEILKNVSSEKNSGDYESFSRARAKMADYISVLSGNPYVNLSSWVASSADSNLISEGAKIDRESSYHNLLSNPGFENDSSGQTVPPGWSDLWNTGGTKTIDQGEKHSGTSSWKFTQTDVNYYQGAYSEPINVSRDSHLYLSVWLKSEHGTEKATLGVEQFDENNRSLKTDYFVFYNLTAPSAWTKHAGYLQTRGDVKYVKVRFFGPYKTVGAVWWDDFFLADIGQETTTVFGCQNNENSKCIDLGSSTGENFDWVGGMMGEKKTEGEINYREVLPNQRKIYLNFPSFNTGVHGLPNSPLILEIKYKDTTLAQPTANATLYDPSALISSKIHYVSSDPSFVNPIDNSIFTDKEEYLLSSLGGLADNTWKIKQISLRKTDFQLIRSIEGKYVFILNPNLISVALPIDYLNLRTATADEASKIIERQRYLSGFTEIAQPKDTSDTLPNYANPELTVFVRDMMRPVYANTKPAAQEINQKIKSFSALGETEPLNFALYSETGINNLKINVSDLVESKTNSKISSNQISVYNVVNENANASNITSIFDLHRPYFFMPDHLESADSVSVGKGQSHRLWLKIKVPEDISGGLYSGKVDLNQNERTIASLAIEFYVLPLKLDQPQNLNPVFHDPFYRVFSSDTDKVLSLYREIGFDQMFYLLPDRGDVRLIEKDNKITDFDLSFFEQKFNRLVDAGLIKKQAVVETYYVWQKIYQTYLAQQPDPNRRSAKYIYEDLSSPDFVASFKIFIDKINAVAAQRNIELIFAAGDELCDGAGKQMTADRTYSILKSKSVKTELTYYSRCDQTISRSALENNYLLPAGLTEIPPVTGLVDYKLWAVSHMDYGYAQSVNNPSQFPNFGYYSTFWSYLRDPVYNRFSHGLFAFSTDAKMVAGYAMGDLVGDSYNGFDARGNYHYPNYYPDFLFAYPTWNGELLPTMGSEGIREGIKDAKYIATLEKFITNPYTPSPTLSPSSTLSPTLSPTGSSSLTPSPSLSQTETPSSTPTQTTPQPTRTHISVPSPSDLTPIPVTENELEDLSLNKDTLQSIGADNLAWTDSGQINEPEKENVSTRENKTLAEKWRPYLLSLGILLLVVIIAVIYGIIKRKKSI